MQERRVALEKLTLATDARDSAFGATAWTALLGTSVGGMAVTPRSATPPAPRGFRSTNPCVVEPDTFVVDGTASESAPGGWNMSWKTCTNALTVPSCGSWRSMIRQITPAAKSEIAIGMNTTVLNATAQDTFSVSTAKISPSAVIRAGTTATQMALFLIAVVIALVEKSVL